MVFVLPSERAGIFLKAVFKKQVSKTRFLPKILSIENFIAEVANLRKIDSVSLLFEFYSVYLKQVPKKPEGFDVFSKWAATALQDFNEIDRHLVPPEAFFSYLKDVKRIEKWDLTGGQHFPTEGIQQHFSFMEQLGVYYEQLRGHLYAQKKGDQGMLYREAVNNMGHYLEIAPKKRFVFLGFNALNRAEERLLKYFLEKGVASVFWDADAAYMNTSKEAGFFMRKYRDQWSHYKRHPFEQVAHHFSKKKTVHHISTPKNVSQIKAVGALLSEKQNFENTALVLADESLLPLALNALPAQVESLNITMGYPLKDMPIAGFFGLLFELYLNQKRLGKVAENKFYYKDVERLIQHSFLQKFGAHSKGISRLKKFLIAFNQSFVSPDQMKGFFTATTGFDFGSVIFEMSQDPVVFVQNCGLLISENKDHFEGFERECLFRFHRLFQQLATLNENYQHIQSIEVLYGIYSHLLRTEKLSFRGEPLSGLQLMGMLETRVLDFETVILTSANEGILPAGKNENSFVPFDVKKHFELPTYQEKDAIFSYHFYRLIQRAKHVYLFYNSEVDAFGAGEKSRFLTQLETDGICTVIKKKWTPLVETEKEFFLEISKTKEVLLQMKGIAASGFSPSALSTYLLDPIRYYKQYLLGIQETELFQETIAANTLGTVVHEVLDDFYKPFVGLFIKAEDLQKMQSRVTQKTSDSFAKNYKNGNIQTGKNRLIFKVAENFISNYLAMELRLLKEGKSLKIIAVEQKISASIQVEGLDFPIQIKGTVDRIDELDGTVRILDYKTGKVEKSQLHLDDFRTLRKDYKYTKALQVMLYAFLYSQKNPEVLKKEICAGIVSFRNLKSGFIPMNFAPERKKDFHLTEERLQAFVVFIKELLKELFDEQTPFLETKKQP